jgi:hypothetical protein
MNHPCSNSIVVGILVDVGVGSQVIGEPWGD